MASHPEQPATSAEVEMIRIRGARAHNLRNLDLDIPRDRFVVITGPSGSGKSSLAFDTLFAEGQRQYLETLSVYVRQFLHQLERPEVDVIEGLPPTVCIDQRGGSRNPRSTVGTVTEILDYLRILLARAGEPLCYQCGTPISQQSPEEIEQLIRDMPEGTRLMLLAPLVRGRRGAQREMLEQIQKAGFVRARIDGEIVELDQLPELAPRKPHDIDAVVDRLVVRGEMGGRLAESLQLALHNGEGLIRILYRAPEKEEADSWSERLFSTLHGCPNCGLAYEELEPRTFSFNSPYGACAVCDGLGQVEEFDPRLVIPHPGAPLLKGIAPWKGLPRSTLQQFQRELEPLLVKLHATWDSIPAELPPETFHSLLYGDETRHGGLLLLLEKELATCTKASRRKALEGFRGQVPCQACRGSRLRPEARSVLLGGRAIHEITALPIADSLEFFRGLRFEPRKRPIGEPLVREILGRLRYLEQVGLGYLALERPADTLSGGEFQRVRLATSIGSGLTGVCYVLDEPSIGLHPRDNQRLIDALRALHAQGNSVLVVEHDEAMMRQADLLLDFGPGAGPRGGRVVGIGTPDELARTGDSTTARFLAGRERIEPPARRRKRKKTHCLVLEGASGNNLREVDCAFPLGLLVCVTGVSGSGKSTLVNETLARGMQQRLTGGGPPPAPFRALRGATRVAKLVAVDQSPIGRSPRSNPATFVGAWDEIRKVFAATREAKQRGFRASRFSFNVKTGRCEECQGQGWKRIEMNFLPDLMVPCESCGGKRFNRQTLQVHYRGLSIADVLELPIDQAAEFFENYAAIHRPLASLCEIGLGYLALGQPSNTLSGGEAQRVKLAAELARPSQGDTLYLLDEPTTGLHFEDIVRLLSVLQKLVDAGNSVMVIEHHLDVIKCADWVIDLGPEGGAGGGRIVAQGTPEEVAAVEESHTGRFLQPLLSQ